MRVCLVSRELSPFGGGGIGTYALSMSRALAASGHEVHVLTQAYPRMKERWRGIAPGVRLHAVNLADASEERLYPAFPMRWSMAVRRSLERLHGQHRFEWIEFPEFYGEGYFALQAKRGLGTLEGVTCVVHLHTPSVIPRELNGVRALSREAAVLDHMERVSIELADLVISPTRALLDRVEKMARVESPTAIIAHPFELDWAPVHPECSPRAEVEGSANPRDLDWLRDPARGNSPPTVLYFGRIEHLKGVDLLVDAFCRLLEQGFEGKLRLIGGDTPTGQGGRSMLEQLRRRIPAMARSRICFEEAVLRAELPYAIASASVCCFPSRWENFPNVCLEAMSSGRAVVASDAGGFPEMLEDGKSGLLFRSGDAGALASALRRALEDESLRRDITAGANLRLAELCEPSRVVGRTVEVVSGARPRGHAAPCRPSPDSPEVTVVMTRPGAKSPAPVERTLASLRAQTLASYEVLFRDPMDAWPPASRGRWLLPLEAGDRLAPGCLEHSVALMHTDPELDLVTFHVGHVMGSTEDSVGGFIPWGLEEMLVLVQVASGALTGLFRRERVEALRRLQPVASELLEWAACCALIADGGKIAVLPEPLVFRPRVELASPIRLEARSRLIEQFPELVGERALRLLVTEAEGARARLEEPFLERAAKEGRRALALRAREVRRRLRTLFADQRARIGDLPEGGSPSK